jgi:putative oxidoreductase
MSARIAADDLGKLLLRVTMGGLMLFHGVHKLHSGIGGIVRRIQETGLPEFFAYGVFVGEVIAPLLIIAGYLTRLAGVVLAFNMVVVIFLAHSGDVFTLGSAGQWKIELPMMYLLGGVAIALLGAGRCSVSRGRGRFD